MDKKKNATGEFKISITVPLGVKEVVKSVSNVNKWWVVEMTGRAEKKNDEFTVKAGTTWKSFKITELIPDRKIVWLVTDCNLPWNTDLKEWKGTKIIWEFSGVENMTQIDFSHIGLAELDCGNQCMNSWTGYIKQSLFKLITEGKGLPNKF